MTSGSCPSNNITMKRAPVIGNALVTGATSGIGAACVKMLEDRGWRVWAAFLEPEIAARSTRGNVRGLSLDLEVPGSAEQMAATFLRESGGGLDLLVHAAGYVEPGQLEWIRPEDLRRQLEINTVGAHAVTRALLPELRKAQGRAVWISSTNGRMSFPGFGAYGASKFALEALADAWRIELAGDGIRLTLVEPGPVETPLWDKAGKTLDKYRETARPEALRTLRATLEGSRNDAIPVGRVVETVSRILDARRPPARVMVARRPWEIPLLRVLPDCLRDALIQRVMRMRYSRKGK